MTGARLDLLAGTAWFPTLAQWEFHIAHGGQVSVLCDAPDCAVCQSSRPPDVRGAG